MADPIERDVAAFLRKAARLKIREPGPNQYVDRCEYSKTGWGIWNRRRRACTCMPARRPKNAETLQ